MSESTDPHRIIVFKTEDAWYELPTSVTELSWDWGRVLTDQESGKRIHDQAWEHDPPLLRLTLDGYPLYEDKSIMSFIARHDDIDTSFTFIWLMDIGAHTRHEIAKKWIEENA